MLRQMDIDLEGGPIPDEIEKFLVDAQDRVEEIFRHATRKRSTGFFPSDYEGAYRALRGLRAEDPHLQTLCEWGSGLGAVTAMAAKLGFEATGIEIDPTLVVCSRLLIEDYQLSVEIHEGSFLPDDFHPDHVEDSESRTILPGAGAPNAAPVEIRDFDVIFAFPWPAEHEMFADLFRRYASYGAVMLAFDASEGFTAWRKARSGDG